MTSEGINTALYKKMYAEQEGFRKWLMFQPPEIILKYAYEYKLKEDIYYLWGIKIWRIFRQNHY